MSISHIDITEIIYINTVRLVQHALGRTERTGAVQYIPFLVQLDEAMVVGVGKIDMSIVAREANIPRTGAVELRMVGKIIDELSDIAGETDITLTGLDSRERSVLIDSDGFSLTTTVNEEGRSAEFRIDVTCWGLHK